MFQHLHQQGMFYTQSTAPTEPSPSTQLVRSWPYAFLVPVFPHTILAELHACTFSSFLSALPVLTIFSDKVVPVRTPGI